MSNFIRKTKILKGVTPWQTSSRSISSVFHGSTRQQEPQNPTERELIHCLAPGPVVQGRNGAFRHFSVVASTDEPTAIAHEDASAKGGVEFYEKSTNKILQAPLGSFDSRAWYEAEWTARFWNRQRTVQSVLHSLDLMERFIQEYLHQCKQHQKAMPLPTVLTTANLNFTVNNWQRCAKSLVTPAKRSSVPNPTTMLEKIDYFRSCYTSEPSILSSAGKVAHFPLQPNIYTYSMILDALAFGQPDKVQSEDQISRELKNNSSTASLSKDAHGNIGWYFMETPAPELSEKLLHRLMEESKADKYLRPTIVTFNSVINAWSRSRLPEAPERAEAILRTIQQLATDPQWEGLHPTNKTFGSIIHTWANSRIENATERVTILMQELQKSEYPDVYPNSEIYLGVLKAWGHSQDPQAAEKANEILQEFIGNFHEEIDQGKNNNQQQDVPDPSSKEESLKPHLKCFLAVMNIYAKRGDADSTSALLEQLYSLYESSGRKSDLCPNTAVFNCVLRAWSRSKSKEAPIRIETILDQMVELAESTGNTNLYPDLVSYNSALHSLTGVDPKMALSKAEKIFNIMEKTPGMAPDLVSYNNLMHLLVRSKSKDAAEKTEGILRSIWNDYSSGRIGFMPDATSYNICIDAWKDRNEPSRAEALLQELQEQYQRTGNKKLQPTRVSYGSTITAWARSNQRGSAENAQQHFDEMLKRGIHPTTAEFNTTIHAWAKVGNVDRAEQLLGKSLENYTQGNTLARPDVKMFTSVLNALAKRRSRDPWADAQRAEAIVIRMEELSQVLGQGVKPNSFSFNAVLDCYSRCRKNEAAPRHAEKILKHMHAIHDAGNRSVKPSVISYTSVMNCWVNSFAPEAPDRVEQLYQDLKSRFEATGDRSLKPSQYTFNALIGAYARNTTRSDSVDKAKSRFLAMIEQYRETGDLDLRPGPMHFSAIMGAMSRRGLAEEANQFLEDIVEICREYYGTGCGGKIEIVTSFNSLITAHAKSKVPGSAEKAEAAFRRMQNLGPMAEYIAAPPNVYSYTSVMLAWSLASTAAEKAEAVTKCEVLLQEMLSQAKAGNASLMPNQFTFGTFLQVIAGSSLANKKEKADDVLETMRQCGVKPDSFVLDLVKVCERG